MKYSKLKFEVVTFTKRKLSDHRQLTSDRKMSGTGQSGHNSPESVVHNIRGALFALLVSPLEPSAEQGDGQAWIADISH